MLEHPRALAGLSDAGAHVGTVCDASFTTFMLTHWVRDRAEGRLPLERAVEMMTRPQRALPRPRRSRPASRPACAPTSTSSIRARLSVGAPQLVRDLPAGGRRFLQKGDGYVGTWVAGQLVQQGGRLTAARPGRLVRAGR